jgi:folate-binding protein YgfZ
MLGHTVGKVGDVVVSVSRVPYLGADSYFIGAATADASVVIEKLLAAGASSCEMDAIETRRIECGTPLYGTDITIENLPQEVNRDALAIHFKKGCYLGQETVARIDALGHVNKLLVQLKFAADAEVPARQSDLVVDGKAIGRVTSSTWSPEWNAPLALAYVRREHARPGTQLTTSVGACEVISGSTSAQV